jgi:hypothetical protein
LLELINTLSKTVDAWDEFEKCELAYFLNDHTQQDASISSFSILAIRKHVKAMRDRLRTLQNQEQICHNIAKEVRFAFPSAEAARVANWLFYSSEHSLLSKIIGLP